MKRILRLYLKNLVSGKLSFVITILGYSISIAIVIVLIFYIIQEKSYNRSFNNVDNIYMVVTTNNESYVEEDAKEILVDNYPQVKSACRYYNVKSNLLYNKRFFNGQVITSDEGFFDVFSIQFKYGDKGTAFSDIQSIILTESFAKEIFDGKYPLGETIEIIGGKRYKISGIIKDFPANSSIHADCIIHYKNKTHTSKINDVYTTKLFIVVNPKVSINDLEKEISSTLVKSSKILNNNIIDFGEPIHWKLVPFKTAYFNSELEQDHLLHANKNLIQVISIIAIIVLLLAIINYINLTSSESITRIKEISILKINGAGNIDIFKQLIIESLITCFIAAILAFVFTIMIIPIFETIVGKHVSFIRVNFFNVTAILMSICILGIIAGLSPALAVSRYSPLQLLNAANYKKSALSRLRNGLVTFQFSVATIMIIVLFLILKQVKYSQEMNIGFDTNNLISIEYPTISNKMEALRNHLESNSDILSTSFTWGNPININSHSGSGDPIKSIWEIAADDHFIETFRMKLKVGRNIKFPSEIKECLITENAYIESGWNDLENRNYRDHKVVGVINTFNHEDLHKLASNGMISNSNSLFTRVNVRLNGRDVAPTLSFLSETWDKFFPGYGFRYTFYDEWVNNSFEKERNQARIASVFAIISIILSCLGLYGLVSYSLKLLIKEIGIRKINGAKRRDILYYINLKFLRWVVLAIVIASPISLLLTNLWLSTFAYKTKISFWIFIVSGFIIYSLALMTTSWKSFLYSNKNPIDAIRNE